MRRLRKGLISCLLAGTMLIVSACGQSKEAPELLKPVATKDSYRPVEYGTVGDVSMYKGVVTPDIESYFWTTSMEVEEILVGVGDYVKAGDVLARADIEAAKDQRAAEALARAHEQDSYASKQQLNAYDIELLELKKNNATSAGDTQTAADIEKQLEILRENIYYEDLMHSFRLRCYDSKIAEYDKVISDGTITARSAGYVSFVTDINESNQMTSGQPVVLVADYDNCYIELSDMDISEESLKKMKLDKRDKMYTMIGGQEYALSYYDYLPEEKVVAENRGLYMKARFKMEDASAYPSAGTVLPVYLAESKYGTQLIVDNSSVFMDSKGSYVYVKGEDGERETRYVTVGESGTQYTEILEGLAEGEKVYYKAKVSAPAEYGEYEITYDSNGESEEATSCNVTNQEKIKYKSDFEGVITDVKVETNQEIKKGDLLFTIKTNDGSAQLSEMQLGLKELTKQFNKDMADYEAAEQAINEMDTTEDPALAQENAIELNKIGIQKEMTQIDYNYNYQELSNSLAIASRDNNGSGSVNIYAKRDGVVSDVLAVADQVCKPGDALYYLNAYSDPYISVLPKQELYLGQTIEIKDGASGNLYKGKIYASTGDPTDVYSTIVDDRVYLSVCQADAKAHYYVKMVDDVELELDGRYTASYAKIPIENSVFIPFTGLHMAFDSQDEEYWYVWRIVDGDMVFQMIDVYDPYSIDDEKWVTYGLTAGDVIAVADFDIPGVGSNGAIEVGYETTYITEN